MGEIKIKLASGIELPFLQAIELARLVNIAEEGTTHWHKNDCGCCVTLHGPDYAYVVGPDGESTFFPERGCKCSH